jgi:hypothetical protein
LRVIPPKPLFRSFFMAGFECSTHRRHDRRRLDLIAGTHHDLLAASDYRQLADYGIRSVRDGVRWHLVEEAGPGQYDWSPVMPLIEAANRAGSQVIWDLCHYGWPDWLDIWSEEFVSRFADYAAAFARMVRAETGAAPMLCPMNEISFVAWSGGSMGHMNPFAQGKGNELKRQVVRAAIAGTRAARAAAPDSVFLAVEPRIHIVPRPGRPEDQPDVDALNGGQWEAWDMLLGRREPELGGSEDVLDIVGVNFYWNNQWLHQGHYGQPLSPYDDRWRPLRHLLGDVHARYNRPLFVAETSCEGDRRAPWFRYVAEEVREAVRMGLPVEGICLYPVLSHPGWDNDRYCDNGLLEMEAQHGRRVVHAPLLDELRRQQAELESFLATRQRGVAAA